VSDDRKLKPMPPLRSDEEAERFVDEADLSEYDLSGFRPMSFELEPKSVSISLRLPRSQLDEVKAEASKRGVPYQRLMRDLLQRGMRDLKRA
jgi:predicted DNA binding CopG/RHH family protein